MQRIAIIGIGCRFPGGADDAASYWDNLRAGRCAIGDIPPDRWGLGGFHDAVPDNPYASYSRWGGFLRDIRGFDAGYFALSPREAAGMDPQQRLLLMAAVEAAADARLTIAALRQAGTGVFVGVSTVDYGLLQRHRPGVADIQAGTGTALSIVANRVSNRLDLSGPSMGIDTACSSALVAVDTACRHLAGGTCDMALAGGVNILLDPRMFLTFSRAHMLSPSGHIRAFDARADGFVRGEGVGIVLLRRLEDAVTRGDRIYAVIEATGVNQDGRTGTITEPSAPAQIELMRRVAESAGVDPALVAYAEAHGTGTPIGDPIEANAIGTVFGSTARKNGTLPIGSAKTNLGHLEPAAGIAGLIKAALVLHHGEIPPSLGFQTPNPAIDLDALGLAVPTALWPLEGRASARRALVNAFGFGGTNACAILAEAPLAPVEKRKHLPLADRDGALSTPVPVPLSAPTARHLAANAAALLRAIEERTTGVRDVAAIAAALAGERDHHDHRAVVMASTTAELVERLAGLAAGGETPAADRHAPPQVVQGRAGASPRIVFTFTGQGGQWWAMGRELISREPVFRRSIEVFDEVFQQAGGWSVMEALTADEATSRIDDAAITPAVMFAFQNGLVEVWRARGIIPDIVLGHSFGEVTAAFVAGGIGMSEVARLVDQRGLIRHRVDRVGTMAAIGLGADAIAPLLPPDGSIEIGGYNASDMVTLTGEVAAIDALIARLQEEMPDVLARRLALDFAYHSSWFAPVEAVFMEGVGPLDVQPPRLPVVSTVTGEHNTDFSTAYWWRNLRYPVLYARAVETALNDGGDIFLELGPHRTLSSMTAATAAARRAAVTTVSTLERRWDDLTSLAVATARLWVAGAPVDWKVALGADAQEAARDVVLPRMPWLLDDHWQEPSEAAHLLRPKVAPHPLLGRAGNGPDRSWKSEISLQSHPYLADHRIDGAAVFPAAGYIEMLYAAACEITGGTAIELENVAFPAALHIGADDEIELHTIHDAGRRRLVIHSRARGEEDGWTPRASAFVLALEAPPEHRLSPLVDAGDIDVAAFYTSCAARGYGWGRQFQGLRRVGRKGDHFEAAIAFDNALHEGYRLDPRVLDSALQLTAAAGDAASPITLPSGIRRVTSLGRARGPALAQAMQTPRETSLPESDVFLATPDGRVVVEMRGLHGRKRAGTRRSEAANAIQPAFLRETFEPIQLVPPVEPSGRWLVVGGAGAVLDLVKAALAGHPAEFIEGAAVDGLAERLASAARDDREARFLFVADSAVAAAPGGASAACERVAFQAIEFSRAIAALPEPVNPARVVFLTCGARSVEPGDTIEPSGVAQAGVLGVGRTLAMEAPGVRVRLVDVPAAGAAFTTMLSACLHASTEETELAIRGGRTLAARLAPVAAADLRPGRVPSGRGARWNVALRPQGGAGIDGLDWETTPARTAEAGEIEIDVQACGLNFRDVMAATGALPEAAESTPAIDALGLEFAGTVRRVGPRVSDIKAGQRVLGMARGCMQRRLTVPRHAVHPTPAALGDAEAACLPSVYLTAWHALVRLARVEPGETVLVHSASGGLGLAAIAIARHLGAHVIATAGTPEKRCFLEAMGVAHVFSSRNIDFAAGVKQATEGRGVDVVMNSLGGAFIERSLSCIAPYGRFIELGKRDIHSDAALGMRRLAANISFHAVDLSRLIVDRPQDAASAMREVLALVESGALPPLPVTAHPAHQAAEAFRAFAAARHTGKVAITLDESLAPRRALAKGVPLDGEGTYLVTGGTRGFGLEVARWLAERGAGHVVVASRGGRIEGGNAGCRVTALALDVGDDAAVASLVGRLADGDRPFRGIVHAAVTYDDALLADMTRDRLHDVLQTKVAGAWNLTHAVAKANVPLDFFVSMSSLAQVTGWPGQSNYAAANASLEALSHHQRALGIPGQCINWGMLGQAGQVARSGAMTSYLESAGWIGISNAAALEMLARALDSEETSLTIASADWRRLAAAHASIARAPRMARLREGARNAAAASDTSLEGLEAEALDLALLHIVRAETAKVLRTPVEAIEGAATPKEAGIDSLSSFELHNRLEQRLGIELPIARYARASRFSEIAALAASLISSSRSRGDG